MRLVVYLTAVAGFSPQRSMQSPSPRLHATALDEVLYSAEVDILDPSTESRSTLEGCYSRTLDFVQSWATVWEGAGTGLTTPIELQSVETGARLLFRPRVSTYESKEEEKQQYRRLGSDDTLRARYEGKLVGERALMRVCMRFDGYTGGEFRIAGGKLQQMMYGARDVQNLYVTLDEHAGSSDAAIQDHWEH